MRGLKRIPPRACGRFLDQWAQVISAGTSMSEAVRSLHAGANQPEVRAFTGALESALDKEEGLAPGALCMRQALGPGAGALLLALEGTGRIDQGLRVLSTLEFHRAPRQRAWRVAVFETAMGLAFFALVPSPFAFVGRLLMGGLLFGLLLTRCLSRFRHAPLLRGPRRNLHALFWKLPLAGSSVQGPGLVRYLWTLGTGIDMGMSLLPTLESARATLDNVYSQEQAGLVESDIDGGASLSESLIAHFPLQRWERALVQNAERTGELPRALSKVAEARAEALVKRAKKVGMTLIIVPYVLFVVPFVVLVFVLAQDL